MKYPTFYRTSRIDGLSSFYREAGATDAPILLLLHGLRSSSRMFEPVFSRLSDHFHLVAFHSFSTGSCDGARPRNGVGCAERLMSSGQSCRTIDSHCGHVSVNQRTGVQVFSDLALAPRCRCRRGRAPLEREGPVRRMPTKQRTMIVSGAAKGISAGATNAFIERDYNVAANSLNIAASTFVATGRPDAPEATSATV